MVMNDKLHIELEQARAQADEYAATLRALRKEKDGADRRLKESHGHIERLTERTKAEQATVQREMMDFKARLAFGGQGAGAAETQLGIGAKAVDLLLGSDVTTELLRNGHLDQISHVLSGLEEATDSVLSTVHAAVALAIKNVNHGGAGGLGTSDGVQGLEEARLVIESLEARNRELRDELAKPDDQVRREGKWARGARGASGVRGAHQAYTFTSSDLW